jgi:hypothetical protein
MAGGCGAEESGEDELAEKSGEGVDKRRAAADVLSQGLFDRPHPILGSRGSSYSSQSFWIMFFTSFVCYVMLLL